LDWNANVTLVGPNGNQGVDKIKVGFIQHATYTSYSGYYGFFIGPGGQLAAWYGVSSMTSLGALLDTAGSGPWYQGSSMEGNPPTFFDATPASNSATIGSLDTPGNLFVGNFQNLPIGLPTLQQVYLNVAFQLDVAAETTDTTNDANQAYWGEAGGSWVFNGDGTVAGNQNALVWTAGASAGVTPPSGWTPFGMPTWEAIGGFTATQMLSVMQFKASNNP
jgi:hypothetical protein